MIDFSKLKGPLSAEERAAEDERRLEQAVKDDHARRLELSKHSLAISPTDEPEGYFSLTGRFASIGSRPNSWSGPKSPKSCFL